MRSAFILAFLICGSALWLQATPSGAQSTPQFQRKSAVVESAQNNQQKQTAQPETRTAPDADLRKAQQAEAEAETKYYQAQTEKLKAKPQWWEAVAPSLAPLGAILAVLVAFLSFGFNYVSTIWNQQDTQFYEALKRFGDKDSPVLRASAAVLLAELGARTRLTLKKKIKSDPWLRTRPFLETALDQLTVGLLLEESPVVLGAINTAALELMALNPWPWLRKLISQNLDLQKAMGVTLADFFAEETKEQQGEIQPANWQSAAAVCGYRSLILETLAERLGNKWSLGKKKFDQTLGSARIRLRKANADSAGVSEALRLAAMRLRSNVAILSEAIFRFHPEFPMYGVFLSDVSFSVGRSRKLHMTESQLQDITCYGGMPEGALYNSDFQGAQIHMANMKGAQLFGCGFEAASLSDVDLRNVDLEHSRLNGTRLDKCRLDGAKLYGARIDAATQLYGTNWWAADFTSSHGSSADNELLEKLYDRVLALNTKYSTDLMFGKEIDASKWLDAAHPTVRAFVEAKQGMKI